MFGESLTPPTWELHLEEDNLCNKMSRDGIIVCLSNCTAYMASGIQIKVTSQFLQMQGTKMEF